jgi:hypothetical protein
VFPTIDVWKNPEDYAMQCVVYQPWAWVMEKVQTKDMKVIAEVTDLPLAKLQHEQQAAAAQTAATAETPRQRRHRSNAMRGRPKHEVPAVLRMEVVDPKTNQVIVAWHGTSSAFDGLEDKDALVRTIQRCRVEALQLSPPSVLINWDVSLEECRNVIGTKLPTIASNKDEEDSYYAVLKEPMGSQGKGIYFVKDVDEIHQIIDEHHQRANTEPEVLEGLIAAKGRIPSWGMYTAVLSWCVHFLCFPCLHVRIPFPFLFSPFVQSCKLKSRRVFWSVMDANFIFAHMWS